MNKEYFKILLAVVGLIAGLIISVHSVSAACMDVTEDLFVNGDVTFCGGTYNVNDAGGDGSVIINESNIVVDCNNSKIIGGFIADSYAIYDDGFDNVTLLNCNISGFDVGIYLGHSNNHTVQNLWLNGTDAGFSNDMGVWFDYSNNSKVINATILNKADGVAYDSYNLIIRNSSFYNMSDSGIYGGWNDYGYNSLIQDNYLYNNDYPIYVWNADNSTIDRNIIENLPEYGVAIEVDQSSGVNLTNNEVFANNTAKNRYGFLLWHDTDALVENNNITLTNDGCTGSSSTQGLYDDGSSSTTYTNNRIVFSNVVGAVCSVQKEWYGLFLDRADNAVLVNNTFLNITTGSTDDTASIAAALYLYRSDNASITGTTINNVSSNAGKTYGIYQEHSSNATYTGLNMSVILGDAITSIDNDYTSFVDSAINNVMGGVDLNISTKGSPLSGDTNITFINTSFNESNTNIEVSGLYLNVEWYLDVTVNNLTGAQYNASVNITDKNSATHAFNYTDVNGQTPRQTLKEYAESSTGKTYLTDYTIYAGLNGVVKASTTVNLSENKNVTITINPLCVSPSDDYLVNESITFCNGVYSLDDVFSDGLLIANADNIVIDCDGATITDSAIHGGHHGIFLYVENFDNVTLKNCNLNVWDTGLEGLFNDGVGHQQLSFLDNNITDNTNAVYVHTNNPLTSFTTLNITGNNITGRYGVTTQNDLDDNKTISNVYVEDNWMDVDEISSSTSPDYAFQVSDVNGGEISNNYIHTDENYFDNIGGIAISNNNITGASSIVGIFGSYCVPGSTRYGLQISNADTLTLTNNNISGITGTDAYRTTLGRSSCNGGNGIGIGISGSQDITLNNNSISDINGGRNIGFHSSSGSRYETFLNTVYNININNASTYITFITIPPTYTLWAQDSTGTINNFKSLGEAYGTPTSSTQFHFYSSNFTIIDSQLYNNGAAELDLDASNITTINASHTSESLLRSSKLSVKWWLNVFMLKDSAGWSGANVSLYRNTTSFLETRYTDAEGNARFNVTDYVLNDTGLEENRTGHVVTVSKDGFTDESDVLMDTNKNVTFNAHSPNGGDSGRIREPLVVPNESVTPTTEVATPTKDVAAPSEETKPVKTPEAQSQRITHEATPQASTAIEQPTVAKKNSPFLPLTGLLLGLLGVGTFIYWALSTPRKP